MKKLFILALMIWLMAGFKFAFGAPFLVSDPYVSNPDTEDPVSATILQDDVPIAVDIALEPDMSIKYDLGSMPVDKHVYTGFYKDQYGRPSEMSDPFILKGSPSAPSNIRVMP